jgi:hypothetical protein
MWGIVRKTGLTAVRAVTVLALTLTAALIAPTQSDAATSGALTRYPYLTDSVQAFITINWATDTTGSTGSVTWGPVGDCAANNQAATKSNLTVNSKAEYQWAATIPVTPDTQYCYRVKLGATDLLGTDPSPVFKSQVAAGSATPYSFAVFGDWGQAYANGNTDQTNVLSQIAQSGARFAVMTGDTAYPGGGQAEYGDLQQSGVDKSTIFGPTFWGVPGRSVPVFNVTGNHGFSNGSVQIQNWPQPKAVATSNGKYAMETYCCVNGSASKSYPSMWYAVDAGPARFYMLTAAWGDTNAPAPGSVYKNDADAHWKPIRTPSSSRSGTTRSTPTPAASHRTRSCRVALGHCKDSSTRTTSPSRSTGTRTATSATSPIPLDWSVMSSVTVVPLSAQ